ncbi:hypothetical protein, conserved [Plasmodium gonderi]|uniref:Uncharacterized protein n=1 Tax=Plasmodium gonderi TaxID=77519 RepID=A0A1Y1JDT9_PLAGO|nr:hypothetical protein, conserved [Plasmodium gonderi]GAW80699.1 hypothetical protein, conserved [Plasmodium gonderi]
MGSVAGRNWCNLPKDEDIDEFLEKVNDVTEKVNGLLSGKISIEEIEREQNKLQLGEKIRQMREEEKRECERREYLMGVRGSGVSNNNYEFFCLHCLVEFKYVLEKCTRCGSTVISKEQRVQQLREKVEEYKKKKKERDLRRSLWKNYLKNGTMSGRSGSGKSGSGKSGSGRSGSGKKGSGRSGSGRSGSGKKGSGRSGSGRSGSCRSGSGKKVQRVTSYEKWNYYEPSSDSFDEDERMICVPKNNKDFQVLEKKIESDIKKKSENRKIAYSIKTRGNKYFKEMKYHHAIECYEEALQVCKDYLEIYNNLALCYIKTYRYEDAINSCDRVIHYYEIFKNDFHQMKNDTLFKSYLRKGFALFKLFRFEESSSSFNSALSLEPNNEEALSYVHKCHQMQNMEKGGTKNAASAKSLHAQLLSENVKEEPQGTDLRRILGELDKMDIEKDEKKCWEYLKRVKSLVSRNEKEKLIFCNSVYTTQCNKNSSVDVTKGNGKRTTFLSFCADKLQDILFYVKKKLSKENISLEDPQKLDDLKLPKYMSRCSNILTDLMTLVLEEDPEYADFCMNAIKPVITLYQLNQINKMKCVYFLNSIGKNVDGRKSLCKHALTENHFLLKIFFMQISHLIAEDRNLYTKEKYSRFTYLTDCVLKSECGIRFEKELKDVLGLQMSTLDKELSTNGGRISRRGNSNEIIKREKNGRVMETTRESDNQKKGISRNLDPWKMLQKKTAKLYEHKFELANLFGIISHLTLTKHVLDVVEKKFMIYVLNIIIYINEKLYDYNEMNCNYLSLLVNLVANAQIRSILMMISWNHLLHFLEHADKEYLFQNMLSLLFNLTTSWGEEYHTGNRAVKKRNTTDVATPNITVITQTSIRRIIHLTRSNIPRVAELSYLFLSRVYMYAYCDVVHFANSSRVVNHGIGVTSQGIGVTSQGSGMTSQESDMTSQGSDMTSEGNRVTCQGSGDLAHSLRRKIEKENDKLVQLDRHSFELLKRSILYHLNSVPRETSITSACINLVSNLSKYTNFLLQLLYEEKDTVETCFHVGDVKCNCTREEFNALERLTNRLSTIFLSKEKNIEQDESISIIISNIATFFTQILKNISLTESTINGKTDFIFKEIERIIPHAAHLVNTSSNKSGHSKSISFFLSYCFLNSRLKSTILCLYHNDVRWLFESLRVHS